MFVLQNLEWKAKSSELDQETEKLHRMIAAIAENLKAKISYSLELTKYLQNSLFWLTTNINKSLTICYVLESPG